MEIRRLFSYGFPGYQIREDGVVFQNNDGKPLKPVTTNQNGAVRLKKPGGGMVWIQAHRLVAMVWLANPNEYGFVTFKDGDNQNRHYTNLEWSRYFKRTTREQVLEAAQRGYDSKQIAESLGVARAYVKTVMKELQAKSGFQAPDQ